MTDKLDIILAEISAGELIDKITILEIKEEKITDNKKLVDIKKELFSLNKTFKEMIIDTAKIEPLISKLKIINLKLWDIENDKRLAEKKNDLGKSFIELARNVYKENDQRSKIKLEINKLLGSNIKEVKSHY